MIPCTKTRLRLLKQQITIDPDILPVTRGQWSSISLGMLWVTCRSWGRLRGVVVWTPSCVWAVVWWPADISGETDSDSGRQPGPPGRGSTLACGSLREQKVKCFKIEWARWKVIWHQTPHLPVITSSLIRLMWVKDSSAAETSLARLFLTFLSYSSTSW